LFGSWAKIKLKLNINKTTTVNFFMGIIA